MQYMLNVQKKSEGLPKESKVWIMFPVTISLNFKCLFIVKKLCLQGLIFQFPDI